MKERILHIITEKKLSPSRLADEIGVQRSNISHILSGRNKPGLEIIQKILKRYSEIDPKWLLLGEGNMNNKKAGPSGTSEKELKLSKQKAGNRNHSDEIEKILVFYKDNSFKEYTSRD